MVVQSLRHCPISPARDPVDWEAGHSATISRRKVDSTASPHMALSPPLGAMGQSPSQATSSAGGAEERLHPHHAQAGRTGPNKATQELAGEVNPHGHTAYHSAADAKPQVGAMTLQGMDQEAVPVTQKMTSIAAQKLHQPLEPGDCGKQGHTTPESDLMLQQGIGTSATKQASLMDPPTMSQGAPQHTVASPEAAAARQAAGQAAQQAKERLRELVMGADYSEKDWYYVDPQVICGHCQLHPWNTCMGVHK